MRPRLLVLAFLLLAGTAEAQRGAAPPFEGPRGFLTLDLSDGEPISGFIEHARLLELSDMQRKRLMDIRRQLRAQNAPYMARLDSLRQLAGVNLGDARGLRKRDEEALQRFNDWSRPVIDSIRVNNDVARAEARLVLTPDQRRRLDSAVVADRNVRARPRRTAR